jgi:alpha-1,6-mannosyltransferase
MAVEPGERWRAWLFVLCGLACAGALVLVYRSARCAGFGDLRNLVAVLLASVPFAFAVWLAGTLRLGRASLLTVLAIAWLMRLAPPFGLIVATTDPHRYLWDGHVLRQGVNPYLYAPLANELTPLRDAVVYPQIFRPDMRTVYPPLAELWFLVAALVSDGRLLGWKLVLLLNDTVSIWLLMRLLRGAGRPPLWAVAYAWSPLVVTQLFASAHLDGLLVPWLLVALLWAERRPALAGAALAASALVRPLALLCLPALAWRRDGRRALRVAAGFTGAYALAWLPFLTAGSGLWESLLTYSRHWQFNGSIFRLLEIAFGHEPWVRMLCYIVIAVGCGAVALFPLSLRHRLLLAPAFYFAFAPTVYPWYLVPLAALGALAARPWVVVLPVAAILADTVYLQWPEGPWQVPTAFAWLEYGSLALLLAWEVVRRRGGAA